MSAATISPIAGRPAPASPRARLSRRGRARRVARLGAGYMAAGFVHGVLNTDNINVTGESFDYGPWRFAPVYDPTFTAAYFDQPGSTPSAASPSALGWNLSRLAECLLHLIGLKAAETLLATFPGRIQQEFRAALLHRLGARFGGRGGRRRAGEGFRRFSQRDARALRTDLLRLARRTGVH